MPKLSIIICTHNREKLLPRALDSVLTQDFKDFELIIIDDASSDGTEVLINSYIARDNRIKYFKNDHNLGIAKSRNKGCKIAEGEYIAMLDSDDWWLKNDKLSRQIAILDSKRAIGLIGTGIVLYDTKDNFIKEDIFEAEDKKIRAKILAKNQFAQSSVIFRKEAHLNAGGYDESLSVCEDLDLWLKIGLRYELANIPEALTAYLVNPEGISKLDRHRLVKVTDDVIEKYKLSYPGYLKARLKSKLRFLGL